MYEIETGFNPREPKKELFAVKVFVMPGSWIYPKDENGERITFESRKEAEKFAEENY